MKLTTLCLLLLVSAAAHAQPDGSVRIMTWNLLDLSTGTAAQRNEHFARALAQVRPDILVTQENLDPYTETGFHLNLPLERGQLLEEWGVGQAGGSDYMCYFDREKLDLRSTGFHPTERGYILEYHFVVKATRDTFRLYTCQLKSGETQADQVQRLGEAAVILQRMDEVASAARQRGSSDSLFILAGDLNMYSSAEPGYVVLTNPNSARPDAPYFFDPIERGGDWSNTASFADIHTSSTRARQFGGGESGGLSHRFDQILYSSAMGSRYVNDSYTTFGNDGQHFNDSINRLPNLTVADSIAESLHAASDHLPVYADFIFSGPSSVKETPAPQLSMISISPQPATDRVTLRVLSPAVGSLNVRLVDATGETVLRKRAVTIIEGEQTVELDLRSLPSGVYGYSVETVYGTVSGKIVVAR